jgi:hypothetical protein
MGKWCEVKCNCLNRERVSGSDWPNYGMYRQHFSGRVKPQSEWDEKIKGMYQCGHRDGAFVQFWPGDLLRIGLALEVAYREQPGYFDLFRRVSNWRNYEDEYLALSPDEATLWRLEIEQLQSYLSGHEYMGWREKEAFEKELGEDPFLYGDIHKTLEDGFIFCDASAKTGNPIEFFW